MSKAANSMAIASIIAVALTMTSCNQGHIRAKRIESHNNVLLIKDFGDNTLVISVNSDGGSGTSFAMWDFNCDGCIDHVHTVNSDNHQITDDFDADGIPEMIVDSKEADPSNWTGKAYFEEKWHDMKREKAHEWIFHSDQGKKYHVVMGYKLNGFRFEEFSQPSASAPE
jgi:hypothetical protein